MITKLTLPWSSVCVLLLLGSLQPGTVSAAESVVGGSSVDWQAFRELTATQFSKKFKQMKARGYRPTDIEVDEGRYAVVWVKSGGLKWYAHRDLTDAQYAAQWSKYKKKGFRPVDVDAYASGKQMLWSGIWVKNKEKRAWHSFRNLTSTQFKENFARYKKKFIPVDLEAYRIGKQTYYAVIWVKNKNKKSWILKRNLTSEGFSQVWKDYSAKGYRQTEMEAYSNGKSLRFLGVWTKGGMKGVAWAARKDLSEVAYWNAFRRYRDLGYRLLDFERYKSKTGWRYAAIWQENGILLDWSKRKAVEKLVKTYRETNRLPGISVAIIDKGKTVFRQGFGVANQAKSLMAHGETIYGAASISKAIGATLALRIRDLSPLLFKLSDKIRKYLPELPAHHNYRIRDILTHQSCVRDHGNGVGKVTQTKAKQYNSQIVAAKTFWKNKLICKAPSKTSNYSTPAFTILGAFLEKRTKKTVAELIRIHFSDPLGLPSLRAQYPLKPNQNRSQLYILEDTSKAPHKSTNKNIVASWKNNSWKVLGGGLESSVVDLARFGSAILKNRVVRPTTRTEMWTKKASNYGWTWRINNKEKSARHNGSYIGRRSYLKIYFKRNLVVAIMSNRRNHLDGSDVQDLCKDIASLL